MRRVLLLAALLILGVSACASGDDSGSGAPLDPEAVGLVDQYFRHAFVDGDCQAAEALIAEGATALLHDCNASEPGATVRRLGPSEVRLDCVGDLNDWAESMAGVELPEDRDCVAVPMIARQCCENGWDLSRTDLLFYVQREGGDWKVYGFSGSGTTACFSSSPGVGCEELYKI